MTTQENDTLLRERLNDSYPALDPSDELSRRVSALAAQFAQKAALRTRQRRQFRLGLAFSAVLALAVLTVFLWPTLVAAKTLYHMAGLMDDARSAHIIVWNIGPDGTRTKSAETWYQNGQWRIENPSDVQIWTDGVFWRYEAHAAKATFEMRANGPYGYNSHGFSLGPLLREAARSSWLHSGNIHDQGEVRVRGRLVHQVTMTNYPNFSHERSIILADPATDLPFEIDNQRETYDGWITNQVSELHYNQPLADQLFAVRFPKGTRIVDTAAVEKMWRRKLGRGIVRQRVGDRDIVICDLQMNAEGDVFLLYTAGQYPGDEDGFDPPKLRDDQGTDYRQQWGFQPCSSDIHGKFVRGLVVNGERLDGGWWTPAKPITSWVPRRLTLTFSVNPTVQHVKMHPIEPGTIIQDRAGFIPRKATFTLPIARPACARLPEYAPYMGFPFEDWDLAVGDARVHAEYYRNTVHDLPRALTYYRQVIAARDAESQAIGQRDNDPQSWLDLYATLRDLGQHDEAKQALLHARDEDVGHNNVTQIEAAMRAEGLN